MINRFLNCNTWGHGTWNFLTPEQLKRQMEIIDKREYREYTLAEKEKILKQVIQVGNKKLLDELRSEGI